MMWLEPCKIERYPVWQIYHVYSDETLPADVGDTFVFQGQTLYVVDIGMPGLYVVMSNREQSEIRTCMQYERSR